MTVPPSDAASFIRSAEGGPGVVSDLGLSGVIWAFSCVDFSVRLWGPMSGG